MEQSLRTALNAQLLLRQSISDVNTNLEKIQENKIKIAELVHKNILLTAEWQLLQMKLNQYDGDFGDDNGQLRKELQAKYELLQLLMKERDLLSAAGASQVQSTDLGQ